MDADAERLVAEYLGLAASLAQQEWRKAPHALELDELRGIAYLGLVSAAARWGPYCVTPDTPVLTAALTWIPAGAVEPGQDLVGVDEYPPGPWKSRTYRRAEVVSAGLRLAPCVRMVCDDGREVVSTIDHLWLVRRQLCARRAAEVGSRTKNNWVAAHDLVVGDQIVAPLRVWEPDRSFDGGWLAGILDGEASISGDPRRPTDDGQDGGRTVVVAQNPGAVLDRIKQVLTAMDIPFAVRQRDRQSRVLRVAVSNRRYAMELLGRVGSARLDARRLWENAAIYCKGISNYVRVEHIENVGLREVAALATSTRTFVAAGLVAHNCAEKGYSPEALEFFKPFVVRRVKGAIIDAIRAADWATRSLRTRAKALQEAGQDQGLSHAELAERTGMSITEIRNTVRGMAARPVSIQAEELDPSSQHDVESSVFTRHILDQVVTVIRDLPPDQQTVIALHYHKGLQLQEVAQAMGITESHASGLHARAVLAIHTVMVEVAGHREQQP